MSKLRDELAEKFIRSLPDYGFIDLAIDDIFKAGWDARDADVTEWKKYFELSDAKNRELHAEVKRLREALEFYANPSFETNKGNRARQALAESGDE